jgi:hypothetical protein
MSVIVDNCAVVELAQRKLGIANPDFTVINALIA